MKRLIGVTTLAMGIVVAGTSQAGGVSVGVSPFGISVEIGRCGVRLAAPMVVVQPPILVMAAPQPPVVYAEQPVCAQQVVVQQPQPVYYVQQYPFGYMAAPMVVACRPAYGYGYGHGRWRR